MEFPQWQPLYQQILADFAYSAADDEKAALLLAELCRSKKIPDLHLLRVSEATVCGCGPNLEEEIAAYGLPGTVLAADGAVARLKQKVDFIVTDLDGSLAEQLAANADGAVAVIHAHGDNLSLLQKYVPQFRGPVVPTVQCQPPPGTFNFGGFTDGDRAVLLAQTLGAQKIHLRGFDFNQPYPKAGKDLTVKKKKLQWAQKIIAQIPAVSFP